MGDDPVIVPPSPVSSGAQTTEFAQVQKSNFWTTVGTILGVLIAVGEPLVHSGGDAKWAIIAGVLLATASQVSGALVKLGYIKSRTEVKTSGM